MSERLKPGQLQQWINSATQGDEQSVENIHGYIGPVLRRYADSFLPPDSRDKILLKALSRVDQNLVRFNPRKGNHNVVFNFRNWSGTIFKNLALDEYRALLREEAPSPAIRPQLKTIADFIPNYQQQVEQIWDQLTKSEQPVISLMLETENVSQVAQTLSLPQPTVRQRLHRGRMIIEPRVIEPRSFIRVSELQIRKLADAIYHHRFDGFKFLGIWYTPREIAKSNQQDQEKKNNFY